MKDWLIIVNPNAGARLGEKDWHTIDSLLKKAELHGEVCFTESPNHAIEIVKTYAKKGFRKIISVGGDGTISEIVNGIYAFSEKHIHEFTLGVISVGTGNDWGRMFNIPKEYDKAIEILKKGKISQQDVGCVDYNLENNSVRRYFINVAGLGFDAVVAKKSNEDKNRGRRGKLVYYKNILSNLFNYNYLPTEITIDDLALKVQLFSMNVGICKYNGNGMMQVPNAIPDDGLLDVTVMKKISKFDVILNIKNLHDGSFIKHKEVDVFRCEKVNISSSDKLKLEVDGEFLGKGPFQFSILPRVLNIIVNT